MRKKTTPPMEYLVSVNEYAMTNNITVVSVYNRIKKGYLKVERHSSTWFIDIREAHSTPKRGRKASKSAI